MLPISKDNLCIFGILVCIVGLFYLYKEITKIKKSVVSGGRPSQSVPLESFIPQRVHTPVYDTPVVAPQPQAVQPPPPPPPVASKEE